MEVSVFLPCRKGSERVPRKNIRPFGDHTHGLIERKLQQLLATPSIGQIVISSNDADILDYAADLKEQRITLHTRDEALGSSATSTDALVAHALDLIPQGHILWTHVTAPFFAAAHYSKAITAYAAALRDGYDSLMAVSPIHGFLWDATGPSNYARTPEKWPRTQTIAPLYEVNSALFLNSAAHYASMGDRIGEKPFLFETDKIAGFDIDWPDDFAIAECIARAGIATD